MYNLINLIIFRYIELVKNNYPKCVRMSDNTFEEFKRQKPKRMISDQYLEILLKHYDKCEQHETGYVYRE